MEMEQKLLLLSVALNKQRLKIVAVSDSPIRVVDKNAIKINIHPNICHVDMSFASAYYNEHTDKLKWVDASIEGRGWTMFTINPTEFNELSKLFHPQETVMNDLPLGMYQSDKPTPSADPEQATFGMDYNDRKDDE